MSGHGIDAHGQHLGAEFPESRIFDGNCRHLCRSDIGEIGGIEKKHNPLPLVLRKLNFLGRSSVKSLGFEIRYLVSDLNPHLLTPLAFDYGKSEVVKGETNK
jgi:hypothetical protein